MEEKQKNDNLFLIVCTMAYSTFMIGLFGSFIYELLWLKCLCLIGFLTCLCCIFWIANIIISKTKMEFNRNLFISCGVLICLISILAMAVICIIICSKPILAVIFIILLLTLIVTSIKNIKNDNSEMKNNNNEMNNDKDWGFPHPFFISKTFYYIVFENTMTILNY